MKRAFTGLCMAAGLSAFASTPAEFPGGKDALLAYLSENMKYPAFAIENGIEGKVMVDFIVTTDGTITDVKIARPLDPDLEEEATRLVKGMPAWKPATDDSGKAVASPVSLPITFRLTR